MQKRTTIAAVATIATIATTAGLLSLCALPSTTWAQAWPSRPVKVVVPFPPGGLIDNMARLIAPKLSQELGQPIVIDNKPGAGGNLGAGEVARAAADGYTLLMASPPLTINPALYKKLPYEPRSIAPIGLMGRVPNVLVVNATSSMQTVADLTSRAKARPGHLNYGSNGNATSLHLSAELYKSQAGVFVTHIPYRGAAAAQTAVMSDEVSFMFDNLPSALGLIQGGKLRPLAITTPERSSALPQVPTMGESGLKGFSVFSWFGLAAPAGLPAAVQQKLEQSLERVARNDDMKAAILKAGAEPTWLGAQAMANFMQADTAQWRKVSAYANITLD
jgi:tripartite-type tricarboxylate transporter receptor subunit TctC